MEYHEYSVGGRLSAAAHYDAGSLLTLDIMLSTPGVDFDGGEFVAPLADGTCSRVPDFTKGDAIVFLSHKYHNIEPVTRGSRVVLVAELWEGPEKECPHRCNTTDTCSVTSEWWCEHNCGFKARSFRTVEQHEQDCSFARNTTNHNDNTGNIGGQQDTQKAEPDHHIQVSGNALPDFNGLYQKLPGSQNSRCHYRNEHGMALFYYDANEGGDPGWSLDARNVDGASDVFDGGFLMTGSHAPAPSRSVHQLTTPPLGRLFWQGRLFQGFLTLTLVPSASASAGGESC